MMVERDFVLNGDNVQRAPERSREMLAAAKQARHQSTKLRKQSQRLCERTHAAIEKAPHRTFLVKLSL
jgi:hypothetical protein